MGVKARVMTILMQLGLSNAVVAYWQIKGLDTKHLKKKTLSERFTDIYADKLWIGNRDVEVSIRDRIDGGSRKKLGSRTSAASVEAERSDTPRLRMR